MCSKNNNKSPHFYTYQEGSEGEESEQNLSVSTKHASLNVNHQGSQCSMSSNEMDNMHSVRNEVVSRLSDSDPDNQTQHVHSPHGHNKFHHAGNDCTSQTTLRNQFHIQNIQMYFICISLSFFFFCHLDQSQTYDKNQNLFQSYTLYTCMHHAFCIGFELKFVCVIKTALINCIVGRVKTISFVWCSEKSYLILIICIYPNNTNHVQKK